MEARHGVTSCVCNFLHFGKLFCTASSEIQERQAVKILRLLVGLFDDLRWGKLAIEQNTRNEANLVVALLQGLLR